MKLRLLWPALLAVTSVVSAPASGTELPDSNADELTLLNWSEYLDPQLVAEFESRFGVRVNEVFFESDDLRDELLVDTDGTGYDVVMVNDASIRAYRKRGWLAQVDQSQVPNYKHMDTRWIDRFPAAKDYAIAYSWGTVGIAYRRDLVSGPLTSWRQLFSPAEELRGKIGMVRNARDVMGMALLALGYEPGSMSTAEIEQAGDLLRKQRAYVNTYAYLSLTEESAMVQGTVAAAMLYSGDALILKALNPNIEFSIPPEGTILWCDYLAVLEASRKKELAWSFINFINEPANAARVAQFTQQPTPNKAAERLLTAEFLGNPLIYPTEEAMQRAFVHGTLTPRSERLRNTLFTKIER